jgi:hypothetical protein
MRRIVNDQLSCGKTTPAAKNSSAGRSVRVMRWDETPALSTAAGIAELAVVDASDMIAPPLQSSASS